ncbi:MAG: hypothetical protein QG670_2009 [Thermoproteota archaeon]|nr:hypothetical protein [Thermoproteota archaeon]
MERSKSDIFRISDCPIPRGLGNRHEGVDVLLNLMGSHGVKLHKTEKEGDVSGRNGLIDKSDLVLIKVNAQWKYRGCTNSDVVRGLIQRILEHPDGFDGEVVLFENGQSGGSMDCKSTWGGRYPDRGIHANAEDEHHSFSYLVDEVFKDKRVSKYLLDPIREKFITKDDHTSDGYRKLFNISYPCFTTTKGNRVELKEGVWNGRDYDENLKLITIPVLKHHNGCGITGALKISYGILSMSDGKSGERHYDKLGQHCGEMITKVRTPTINILDCIWVSQDSLAGYPPQSTTRPNQLLASIDPVALDYWAAKHVLYPIDKNEEHDPDGFEMLRRSLIQAQDLINSEGGIRGHKTTMDESEINIINSRCQE